MELNKEQIEILKHTRDRASRGFYCGGGKDMDSLVEAGMMIYCGKVSFCPDKYYRITADGLKFLRDLGI